MSDIAVTQMDDLSMYREIQKANKFVQGIKRSTVTDLDLEIPIICLAAFYSHATYTLLAARQQGTIDESALLRDDNLRRIAKAQLELISAVRLTDDLSIDDDFYATKPGIGFAVAPSVLTDPRW